MERPRNPFILGHRIARPYFCDREEEQKRLTSSILNGRNVVLISQRRMGKTSLIYLSANESDEIREDFIYFFIDILQTNSLAEFTYILGKSVFDKLNKKNTTRARLFLSMLKSLRGQFGFDPVTGSPTFNVQIGDIVAPEYTLDEIFSFISQSDRPVIIAFDEFQQITNYPEKNTEAILRSQIQNLSNATFIFAGSERTTLQNMFISSKRPFYNSAELMHLGPIDKNEYVNFCKVLFSSYDKGIDKEAIEWTYEIFEGNTFYLQRVMNGAFANTSKGNACNLDIVKTSVKEILSANEFVYREILSNISVKQKSVLYAVAKARLVANPMSGEFVKNNSLTSASSVQAALQKLIKRGVITKTPEGYSLSDPLFRIFINRLYYMPEL